MVIMIQAYIDMLAQRIQAHKQKAMVKRARQRQRESIMGNNNIQKVCDARYLEIEFEAFQNCERICLV